MESIVTAAHNAVEPLFDDVAVYGAPIEAQPPSPQLRRLGQKLPPGVFLGTSSWNFPGWRGLVWSTMSGHRNLADKGLAAYSRHPIFRTVGIDRGFYRPLTVGQYAQFAEQVPESFRFLVKAPQAVTDYVLRDERGRPKDLNPDYLNVRKTVEEFVLPCAEGLGEKAGPLVFEFAALPREVVGDAARRREMIDRLAVFFSELPKEAGGRPLLIASEMRTPRILTPRYVNAVRPTGVRPVISLHPTMPNVMRQIEMLRYFDAPDKRIGRWTAAGDIVVRWSLSSHGTYRGLKEDWMPFDRIRAADIVTREGVAWLMQLAARSGVRGFAVANNKAEGCAPLTMRAVAESVADYRVLDDGRADDLF